MREEEKCRRFWYCQGQRERLSREEEESTEKTSGKNLRIQKPVEIFSPKASVSRYVYCGPLLGSDYPFDERILVGFLSLVWILGGRMMEVICLSTLVLDCFYRCC